MPSEDEMAHTTNAPDDNPWKLWLRHTHTALGTAPKQTHTKIDRVDVSLPACRGNAAVKKVFGDCQEVCREVRKASEQVVHLPLKMEKDGPEQRVFHCRSDLEVLSKSLKPTLNLTRNCVN